MPGEWCRLWTKTTLSKEAIAEWKKINFNQVEDYVWHKVETFTLNGSI